jgi:hypothetical protein
MPQLFNNAVMTNKGADLLVRAQAGQIKLQFTRMAVGNGEYASSEKTIQALQKATKLKSQKNAYTLSAVNVYSEHSVKVTALITNYDSVKQSALVSVGYYINEIGLFAKPLGAADSEEILYSIAVVAGDNGDFMPPYNGYNPAQIIQDYYATVDNSTQVTIQTAGAALLASEANIITDDTTKARYKLGINNGNMYYEEV